MASLQENQYEKKIKEPSSLGKWKEGVAGCPKPG
jgi:hypothetical protein